MHGGEYAAVWTSHQCLGLLLQLTVLHSCRAPFAQWRWVRSLPWKVTLPQASKCPTKEVPPEPWSKRVE
eukprot:1146871-Pelagomonas_calceolata.AAC.3